ncbi:hypothetical protein CspeluHIS016_0501590 [Cutaneotrichosporon spelunceum]|uniref:Uncharacterized protein n=1 Tax=Cutaneotrichosporon spelunceum TaxID=1672016 RepID=A0AAD3TWG6_9TREE|nr:hypothetical protein CspeluHIS016_0501590 [Cutaneotrichosporon spelunceum]
MSDNKARGPVEELIAKRLRPLNKKIQRFRGHSSKPEAELNDDQRAGLASLPQLEAAAKELEDLSRAVEDAELVAAGKIREEREAAERAMDARVAAAAAEFQLAVAGRLASFLCLHTLLRPARPNDHENLTFAPLTLPLRLQDEVLATDILRVARMYDDLTTGGEAGRAVLISLSSGPDEEDEEGERVHHLLNLLSQEDEEEESVALDEQSNVPEAPQSVADTLGESEGSEFDPQRTPVVATTSLRQFDEPPMRGVALNFLQEDELAPEPHQFEVEVEMPASNAVSSSQSVSLDWADDDDNDSAARLAAALGSEPEPEPDAEADVTVQLVETEAKPHAEAGPSAASEDNSERRKRKPRPRKKDEVKKEGDLGKGKPVDDEGFEVKTARRASAQRGRGRGRGRGAPGGRQGERGGEVREGGPRRKTENKEDKENGQRRAPRKDNAPKDKPKGDKPKEAKPKPSIYKAVQPGAPVSAPIL